MGGRNLFSPAFLKRSVLLPWAGETEAHVCCSVPDRLGFGVPNLPRTPGSTWTPGSSRETWLYQGHWDPPRTLDIPNTEDL